MARSSALHRLSDRQLTPLGQAPERRNPATEQPQGCRNGHRGHGPRAGADEIEPGERRTHRSRTGEIPLLAVGIEELKIVRAAV